MIRADTPRRELRAIAEYLADALQIADGMEEHLIAALICDAEAAVQTRYGELVRSGRD